MKYTSLIEKAIQTSVHAHRKQYRKGNPDLPYVSHSFSVFIILSEYTNDENILITGLLHDVLEDADPEEYDEEKLKNIFGSKIVSIIKEVSEQKDGNLEQDTAKKNWEERKIAYLEHLKTASLEAFMVSTADKIHNLTCTVADFEVQGHSLWDQFNSPKEKQLWFYEEFTEIINKNLKSDIVTELNNRIQKLKEIMD